MFSNLDLEFQSAPNVTQLCPRGYFPHLQDTNETLCYVICPDLTLFRNFNSWYGSYRSFSFWFNGICLLLLVVLGISGIVLLLLSLRNRRSQYRLTWHVRLLCMWDALALFSMLGLTAIPSLWNKTTEIYGPSSYLIRIFFPISNMANLGSMWQIIAIAAERFLAVAYPFKSHMRNNNSLRLICILIAVGAIVAYGPIVFESEMVSCLNIAHRRFSPMLKQREFSKNQVYKWIFNRVPSFLLRSPTPFAILVFLTVGTLHGRTGNVQLSTNSQRHGARARGWSTALTLTMINIKFIVLQSIPVAYDMLNILSSPNPQLQFYLADMSNLLLTLQSATNWLVFLQWDQQSRTKASGRKQSVQTLPLFTETEIQCLLALYRKNVQGNLEQLSNDVGHALRADEETERALLNGELSQLTPESLETVFRSLATDPLEARERLRALGSSICGKQTRIGAQSWARAKNCIISALMGDSPSTAQERATAAKVASFMIGELKHGMLCQRTEHVRNDVTAL